MNLVLLNVLNKFDDHDLKVKVTARSKLHHFWVSTLAPVMTMRQYTGTVFHQCVAICACLFVDESSTHGCSEQVS